MLNRIVLIGIVNREGVNLRYTTNGKAVAVFNLGVRRQFRNEQGEYEWDNVNIVVWGKQAENAANFLQPKKLAAVDGRLQIRNFDGEDGNKRWVTEVVADTVRFLSPKDSAPMPDNLGTNINFSDEDIPF